MNSDEKPFSPAAERNREPILNELQQLLSAGGLVLEVGSGTGQHAVYFSAAMPQISWQPTELATVLPVTAERIADEGGDNILSPIALDVFQSPWPDFNGAATVLGSGGRLIVYGPFRFDGAHISESNLTFDQQLRAENPSRGIRDVEWLDSVAKACGFSACTTRVMPANNHMLIWPFAAD